MEWAIGLIIMVYFLSILVEILWIPVPSVASTYQLVFPDKEVQEKLNPTSFLYKIQSLDIFSKFLLIIVPYILAMIAYCWPLLLLMFHVLGIQSLKMNSYLLGIGVGVLCLFLGRAITLASAFFIRKDNSQKNDNFDLKTRGFFKHSRNPIVLGLHVGILGMNLIFPSWIFLGLTLIYILNIHFKILLEEDFLLHLFQENYSVYFSKTRRYL